MKIKPILVSLLLPFVSFQAYAQINMGMVGDSGTDDYLGGSKQVNLDNAAGSWGQVLAAARPDAFNFGGYKSTADGTWDDTVRHSGYEYNWATAGAAASDNAMLKITGIGEGITPITIGFTGASYLSQQTQGLANQISAGLVDTAYISIGSNDFFYNGTLINAATNELSTDPDFVIDQLMIDDIASSILTGIDELQAAGDVDLLLGLLPNGGAFGSAERTAAVDDINAQISAGAAARGVAVMDIFSWTLDGNRVDQETGAVSIGHLTIIPGTQATADDLSPDGDGVFCNYEGLCPLDSHALAYSAENTHSNTLLHGLRANEVIKALNSNFGHDIELISDQELLGLVGVSAVPIPAAAWLFGSALIGLAGIKRKK